MTLTRLWVGRIWDLKFKRRAAFENPKGIAKAILKIFFAKPEQLRGKRNRARVEAEIGDRELDEFQLVVKDPFQTNEVELLGGFSFKSAFVSLTFLRWRY